jgi:hypothetical protein
MYVNRMRLHGVKGLHLDLPEGGGELPEPAHKRLLLQGGNGSGKTTILECVQLLWEHFGEWIDAGTRRPDLMRLLRRTVRSHTEQAIREADLAAMELGNFPEKGQSLWVGMGLPAAWEELGQQHPTAQFARLMRDGPDGSSFRAVRQTASSRWNRQALEPGRPGIDLLRVRFGMTAVNGGNLPSSP